MHERYLIQKRESRLANGIFQTQTLLRRHATARVYVLHEMMRSSVKKKITHFTVAELHVCGCEVECVCERSPSKV